MAPTPSKNTIILLILLREQNNKLGFHFIGLGFLFRGGVFFFLPVRNVSWEMTALKVHPFVRAGQYLESQAAPMTSLTPTASFQRL